MAIDGLKPSRTVITGYVALAMSVLLMVGEFIFASIYIDIDSSLVNEYGSDAFFGCWGCLLVTIICAIVELRRPDKTRRSTANALLIAAIVMCALSAFNLVMFIGALL